MVIAMAASLHAQKVTYTWNPRNMLVIGAGGGLSKYFGEFTDQHFAAIGQGHAKYFLLPELAVQLDGGMGNYTYNRRLRDEFKDAYIRQFYRDPKLVGLLEYPEDFSSVADDQRFRNQVMETDKLWFVEGRLIVNLFPQRKINPYLSVGAGMMRYENNNASTTLSDGNPLLNVTFGEEPFTVDTPGGLVTDDSNLPDGANTLPIVPVGMGLDLILTEQVALNADLTYRFLLGDGKDMMDGFGKVVQENFNAAGRVDRTESTENADSWGSFTIGVQVYLFGHSDRDGDGMSDSFEESIGTDPLNPDTDGDGLTDDEEYEIYGTDPLKTDTDDDRLTDAEEVAKNTDPRKPDTDGDGLTEGEEFAHGTDPFDTDSDKDGLTDGEEVHQYNSDPLRMDSDSDGISDLDEVKQYHSDPRLRDTDGDGLEDAEEVRLKTDPASEDSDGDGLRDGAEIKTYKTDPLRADSDGDGRDDGSEINSGSDPFGQDSDGDGIADGDDRCPGEPETVNGYRDEDGCPDAKPLTTEPLEVGAKLVLEGVEFEEASATLTSEAQEILASALQTLQDHPALRVEIGGHTDSRGSTAANRELSQLRAESVKTFLTGKGIDPSRLEIKGYGESEPRDNNATPAGRARNRRIEFKILSVE